MDRKGTHSQMIFWLSKILSELSDAGHFHDCETEEAHRITRRYDDSLCDCPYNWVIKNNKSKNPFKVTEFPF